MSTLIARRRPSVLLPPTFIKLPGRDDYTPWKDKSGFEDHFCISSGRASPVTSDCASSLMMPPSPPVVFSHMSFLDLSLDEPDQEAAPVISKRILASDFPRPPSPARSDFTITSRKRRSSFSQAARDPSGVTCYTPTSPVFHISNSTHKRQRTYSFISTEAICSHRSEAIAANAALENYFGSSGEASKADRCGYGHLGIASTARDWNAVRDFQPLLNKRALRSSQYSRRSDSRLTSSVRSSTKFQPDGTVRVDKNRARSKFQERGGQPLRLKEPRRHTIAVPVQAHPIQTEVRRRSTKRRTSMHSISKLFRPIRALMSRKSVPNLRGL